MQQNFAMSRDRKSEKNASFFKNKQTKIEEKKKLERIKA